MDKRHIHLTIYDGSDLQGLPGMQWAMDLSDKQLERLKQTIQREIDAYKSEEWNDEH